MSPAFAYERRAWKAFRSGVREDALAEFCEAMGILLRVYNTTVRENRFIAGGATEVFLCAVLRTVGIDASLVGRHSVGGDIRLSDSRLLSIKGIFRGGADNVGMVNWQGSPRGVSAWDKATIFVVSEVGLVYGDPRLMDSRYLKVKNDQLSLRKAGLQTLIDRPECLVPAPIPRKPDSVVAGTVSVSQKIGRDILRDLDGALLSKALEG